MEIESTNLRANNLLEHATCSLIIENSVIGTAWLFNKEGYLLTAGHLFKDAYSEDFPIKVQFLEAPPRAAVIIKSHYNPDQCLDFAILKLIENIENIPLPYQLSTNPIGSFISRGYGNNLFFSSLARGEIIGSYMYDNTKEKCLFQLTSKEIGQKGFSGAPIMLFRESVVVAMQVETTAVSSGAGRDISLAIPLYRIADYWPKLKENDDSGISINTTRTHNKVLLRNLPDRIKYQNNLHLTKLIKYTLKKRGIITIEGPPGSGKTSLAVEMVYRLLAESCNQPLFNEVLFVSFRGIVKSHSSFLINNIFKILNNDNLLALPNEQKVMALLDLLQKRKVMLILDDLENNILNHDMELQMTLKKLSSLCLLIMTSLSTVQVFELYDRIRLGYLGKNDSIGFIWHCLNPDLHTAIRKDDADRIDELAALLGGSMKSIKIITQLALTLGLNQVIDDLKRAKDGQPNIMLIHLEKEHSLVWSTLSEPAKKVLMSCAFFHNLVSIPALLRVADLPREITLNAIDELVNAFLLDIRRINNDIRYELHQTTKYFALSQLKKDGLLLEHGMKRMTYYYLELLEKNPEGGDTIYFELNSIDKCLKWSKKENETELFMRLFHFLYDILFTFGHFNYRIELAHDACEIALNENLPGLASHFITVSASTYTMLGDYEKSLDELENGMELAQQSRDPFREAYVNRCIALNFFRKGDIKQAAKMIKSIDDIIQKEIQQSERLHNQIDRLEELHHAKIDLLELRGSIEFYEEKYDEAHRTFEEMKAISYKAKWYRVISYPLRDLAEIEMIQNRNFSKARTYLEHAKTIAREYKDFRQLGRIELSLLKCALHKGQLIKAARHFDNARKTLENMGLENELEELNILYKTSHRLGWMSRFLYLACKPKGHYGTKPIGGE